MNIDDLDLELDEPIVIDSADAARAGAMAAARARDADDLAELLDALGIGGGRVVVLPGPTLEHAARVIGAAS